MGTTSKQSLAPAAIQGQHFGMLLEGLNGKSLKLMYLLMYIFRFHLAWLFILVFVANNVDGTSDKTRPLPTNS